MKGRLSSKGPGKALDLVSFNEFYGPGELHMLTVVIYSGRSNLL